MKLILEAIKSLFRKIEAQRTHWVDLPVEEAVVEKAQFDFTNEPLINSLNIEIVEDKTYKVTFDDVVYECIAYIAEGPNAPSIGNGAIAGASGGNGEPFFYTTFEEVSLLFAEPGSHTISVSVITPGEVHKLDEKYLPEGVSAKRIEKALNSALTAQTTADTANSVAEAARSTADTALSAAEEALASTPDWNQNDESAPNYVKNRTHYIDVIDYQIFYGAANASTTWSVPLDYVVPTGITIDFYYRGAKVGDGKTYKLGDDGDTYASDSNADVRVIFHNNNKTAEITTYSKQGIFEIVAKDLTAFIPLDEKFIPDTIARKSDIPDTSNLALKTEIPDVDSYITTHNTYTASHNDIRDLITGLTNRLNALADSDDTTLDQLSEIVNYIKSNKELIDAVTTSKVNISDIVDNLTTNVSNKPLSAAQGVALKALIDAIAVPTKVSELTNDSGYITGYTETDPTVPAWAKATTKPSYTKSEVGLSNVDNVKQYSASNPPPYPVTSVNGQTGAVTVSVPTKVSQLQNDAGYLTEISKEEIVQQVIAALGTPVYGTVDENNHITLSGHLVDGTYTLSFEDSDGFVVADAGTIKKVTGPSYTNQIPISTDASGAVYNGTGYKVGVRLRSSGEEATLSVAAATNPAFITGYIPITTGQTLYLENCYIDTNGINGSASSTETKNYYGEAVSSLNLLLCNSAKTIMHTLNWVGAATSEHLSMTPDADGIVKQIEILRSGVSFVRLGLAGDAPNAIITVDQPIAE